MQETIGQRLRSARESKNLSIEDAYSATKIHINILSAFENNKFDEVLNPIYVKGFLRRYARYLGIDHDEILKEYAALKAPPIEQIIRVERLKKSPVAAKKINFKYLGLVLLAIFLSFSVIWLFIALKPMRLFKAVKFAKKETAAAPSKAKEKPLIVPKNEQIKLTVKASDDSWMHVKTDGKIIFQSILKKGAKETWAANDKIELWVGNAAALNLDLNGHFLGSPGRGVIKNILVTREGMSKEK